MKHPKLFLSSVLSIWVVLAVQQFLLDHLTSQLTTNCWELLWAIINITFYYLVVTDLYPYLKKLYQSGATTNTPKSSINP